MKGEMKRWKGQVKSLHSGGMVHVVYRKMVQKGRVDRRRVFLLILFA